MAGVAVTENIAGRTSLRVRKMWYGVGLALLLLALAVYHLFFSRRIDTVVPGRIYRSAQLPDIMLEHFIRDRNIRTVLNLTGNHKKAEWHLKGRELAGENRVKLINVSLTPHDLPSYRKLSTIIGVLMNEDRPLLIHCRRGSDRTGMVSALALAIEEDPPLARLKEQFSWKYGVLPLYRSIGPYFFSEYEQWLARTEKSHSRDTLLEWIRNAYTDSRANLEFSIDSVNSTAFRKKKAVVRSGAGEISVTGWAFDARTNTPARDLSVHIDDSRVSAKAEFSAHRPDVAKFFDLDETQRSNFPVGWKAVFPDSSLSRGCHALTLRSEDKRDGDMVIHTGFTLCIEKDG